MTTKNILIVTASLLGASGLVYFGSKFLKNRKLKKSIKDYDKERYTIGGKKLKAGEAPPKGQAVVNLAQITDKIAQDLGTAYSGWNPQSWTENDTEVYKTILTIPQSLIPQVVNLYFEKYKRNLKKDLSELLDTTEYNKVKYLFN
jgi:hypothetical protein